MLPIPVTITSTPYSFLSLVAQLWVTCGRRHCAMVAHHSQRFTSESKTIIFRGTPWFLDIIDDTIAVKLGSASLLLTQRCGAAPILASPYGSIGETPPRGTRTRSGYDIVRFGRGQDHYIYYDTWCYMYVTSSSVNEIHQHILVQLLVFWTTREEDPKSQTARNAAGNNRGRCRSTRYFIRFVRANTLLHMETPASEEKWPLHLDVRSIH